MNAGEAADHDYRFGAFRLQPRRRRLLHGDEIVPLSQRALSILSVLVDRHDRIVTKEEIFAEVWPDTSVDEHNLTVHVCTLRKVLGADAITTIPGRGYKFTAELEQPASGAALQPPLGRDDPPPLADARTNLPQPLTALIGREAELSELAEAIGQSRLVTLAGPGGIGKTRLAIELGWCLRARFPDGVWLVDLAPLSDPSVLTGATATVLGVSLRGADAPVETIATAMGKRRLLMIFDNCEHLVDAAAALIGALLQRVPGVSVLATSQETLRVPAEQVYRLNPLALPPTASTNRNGSGGEIANYGAVALFVARACEADRRFGLTAANAASVIEICRRLDGIPLALEMAAARVRMLGVEGVRTRLDERLHMLGTSPRTAEWRHRTLRDTVAWSYGLLEEADRRVFRHLGCFAGSFSLDAVLAVAAEDGSDPWNIVDALGRLIDKSMVSVEGDDRPRYRLLETLRLYARELLDASGQADAIAERHARYFTELFEPAHKAWETTPDAEWLATYRPELDNVRAALDWAGCDPRRAPIEIALAGTAVRLWYCMSLLVEGRRRADRAVTLIEPSTPLGVAARLLHLAGVLWHDTDRLRTLAALERSASLYRELGDQLGYGAVLGAMGTIYACLDRAAEAEAALNRAQDILAGSDRQKSLFNVANSQGVLALVMRRPEEATGYFARALDFARLHKDAAREIVVLGNLAEVEFGLGAIDRAVARGREAVSRVRSTEKRTALLGWALVNLASYLIAQDNAHDAREIAEEALSQVREEGGCLLRVCLQQWALLAALDARPELASRLLGFVDAGLAAAQESRQATEQMIHDRLLEQLQAKLPAAEILALSAAGSRLGEAEAVALVTATMLRA